MQESLRDFSIQKLPCHTFFYILDPECNDGSIDFVQSWFVYVFDHYFAQKYCSEGFIRTRLRSEIATTAYFKNSFSKLSMLFPKTRKYYQKQIIYRIVVLILVTRF